MADILTWLDPSILLNAVLLSVLVVLAIGALFTRSLLTAIVFLGLFSLTMATQYLVLGAPDVAITEAAVGAGMSTILFLLALSHIGSKDQSFHRPSFFALMVVAITASLLIYATFSMPVFRDAQAPAMKHVSKYYIEQSEKDMGIPNMVTSVLASYRGFDTLGEVGVVFVAGLCVLMLLGGGQAPPKKRRRK